MPTKHRLDIHNIGDDLIRAQFARELRSGSPFWREYTIKPDEIKNPELTAYRIWGVGYDFMKWIVCIITGLEDLRGMMTAGETYRFPDSAWIRQKIREYQKKEKKL